MSASSSDPTSTPEAPATGGASAAPAKRGRRSKHASTSGGAVRTGGGFRRGPSQTLAGRVWVGLVAAAVLLVLVIIFIAENTKSISINFLGLHGHLSEALALLIAVVVGIAISLLVGSARIVQLSVQVRRERKRVAENLPRA